MASLLLWSSIAAIAGSFLIAGAMLWATRLVVESEDGEE